MFSKYQKHLSGPILDRIDIHLDMPRVPMEKLASPTSGEASHAIQHTRFAPLNKPNVPVNGNLGPVQALRYRTRRTM